MKFQRKEEFMFNVNLIIRFLKNYQNLNKMVLIYVEKQMISFLKNVFGKKTDILYLYINS